MGKTVFDLSKVKINIFLNFSSFLAKKKISKNKFPPVAGLKNTKKNFGTVFRGTVQVY